MTDKSALERLRGLATWWRSEGFGCDPTDSRKTEHVCADELECLLPALEAEMSAASMPLDVERMSAKFHAIYQAEAKRQGDVRHHDEYEQLPENIKEFDRVLARYVLAEMSAREAAMRDVAANLLRSVHLEGVHDSWRHAEEAVRSLPCDGTALAAVKAEAERKGAAQALVCELEYILGCPEKPHGDIRRMIRKRIAMAKAELERGETDAT